MEIKRASRAALRFFQDPDYILWQARHLFLYKIAEPVAFLSQGQGLRKMSVVTFFLTWDCNLRCVMCNLWGEAGSCHPPEKHSLETLSVSDWIRAVEELKPFEPEILLTGGEPLLYRGWEKIAARAKALGLKVSLISNGSLFARFKEPILEYVDRINVSLDGPEETHDTIRKQKGHFQKVKEGLEAIHEEKKKRKARRPYINVSCTIQERNVEKLYALACDLAREPYEINALIFQHLEFVGEEGVKASEQIYQALGSSLGIWKGFQNVPALDLALLKKQVKMLQEASFPFSLFFFPPFSETEMERYYQFPSSFVHQRSRRCVGPWVEALIAPDGDFWICPDYPTGNIKRESPFLLWNNERARQFRLHLQRNGPLAPVCRSCQCFYNR